MTAEQSARLLELLADLYIAMPGGCYGSDEIALLCSIEGPLTDAIANLANLLHAVLDRSPG